ncbi:PaaI family thioesterase [Nocardioides marmoriginsengisoli]|uniref:PaaI family thioesterase n=1 Tax=Nocardioides marmoriginsengisoli TaxID=661483 RepID=UPI001622C872|nr:PaaI family thioesterase [Nocardioides marmoriginsengisoli]
MTRRFELSPDVPAPGPFSALLGFRYISIAGGVAVVEADPTTEHCNAGGIVHGGFLSSMLDTTTGWAVHAQLPPGTAAPHVQLSVQYVRAALPGITLVCTGTASAVGRRIASTDAEILQDGRLIARAVASHAVLAAPAQP